MKKIIFAILFLNIINLYCQQSDSLDYSKNLVNNYSFEQHGILPCQRIGIGDYTKFNIDNWAWATYASSDIFSTESELTCFSYINDPKNGAISTTRGTIMPRSGDVMIGFYCNGTYSGREYHEYVITKLKQPLIPENEYYVEFWVCRSARSYYATNNIGACFISMPFFYKSTKSIHAKANIKSEDVISNAREWTKISGNYIPSDTMRYMLIGNFSKDQDCKVISVSDNSPANDINAETYYLLDDVYVLPAGDSTNFKEVEIEKTEYEMIEVNTAIILKNVFFDHDKSDILPQSYIELNKLVDFLTNNPSVTLEISGHTDNTGNDKYNAELSLARSKAVTNYIISNGIMDSRISYQGYGSLKPIDDNNSEEGRQNNRRVEFKILKK